MSLGIEYVFVERKRFVVAEYQVEILESLGEEEALLDVVLARAGRSNVSYARVAVARAAVLLDGFGRVPRPIAVLLVFCHLPEIEIGFDHLRAQDVVAVERVEFAA